MPNLFMMQRLIFGILFISIFQLSEVQLNPGLIGYDQSICSSSTPETLIELSSPTVGTGTYTYQRQSSPDNSAWTDIAGANLSGYSPPALSSSTYYRRIGTSGSYTPVNSNSVLITVSPQITLAQFHDNISIENNTSTNFNVVITKGTTPFTVNYTRKEVAQSAFTNCTSGINISTVALTTGVYNYGICLLTKITLIS